MVGHEDWRQSESIAEFMRTESFGTLLDDLVAKVLPSAINDEDVAKDAVYQAVTTLIEAELAKRKSKQDFLDASKLFAYLYVSSLRRMRTSDRRKRIQLLDPFVIDAREVDRADSSDYDSLRTFFEMCCEGLSKAEREIADQFLEHRSQQEIAGHLGVTATKVSRVKSKLIANAKILLEEPAEPSD